MVTTRPASCPNLKCDFHGLRHADERFDHYAKRDGFFTRACHPYRVQRFKCRACGAKFSEATQSLENRFSRRGLTLPVFRYFCEGMANRQIARTLSIDEKLVRTRLGRLGRHALCQHEILTKHIKIDEAVAMDGCENFARSQYEPNNVNQAIGYDSHFIYDFNFAPLNRKGKMSERQKRKKAQMEFEEGKFPKFAIRDATQLLLERLVARCRHGQKLELLTDQHFQYVMAIEKGQLKDKIIHRTVSSKATRLYRHILFPVNHLDLLLRHHDAAFKRETIAFSKKHSTMILRYALKMAWKNYFRPQFTKRHKRDPHKNRYTPAMRVGVMKKPARFYEFFGRTMQPEQVHLQTEWRTFHAGRHTFPKRMM